MLLTIGVEMTEMRRRTNAISRRIVSGVAGLRSMATRERSDTVAAIERRAENQKWLA